MVKSVVFSVKAQQVLIHILQTVGRNIVTGIIEALDEEFEQRRKAKRATVTSIHSVEENHEKKEPPMG